MKIDTRKIPKPIHGFEVAHEDGDTQDIINELLKADRNYYDKDFCQFAQQFKNGIEGLRLLWKFVRTQIQYKEDGFNFQGLQSPAALWASKKGDCKSKTLFVNAVLRCLGIAYKIRFAAYGTKDVTHVYTIAKVGGEWIPIDTVYSKFGQEVKYTSKKDYSMTKIVHISGTTEKPRSYKGSFATLAKEYQGEINKVLIETKQKASYVPKAEFIPFSQLDEGEAKARILLRQFEIQARMKPEKEKEYNEMVAVTKRLLYNGGKGFTASNAITGYIPKGMEAFAGFLQQAMKDTRPAIKIRRPEGAKIKGFPWPNSPVVPAMSYFSNDAAKTFFLGRGGDYQKTFSSIIPGTGNKTLGQVYAEAINAFTQLNAQNAAGQQLFSNVPGTSIQIPIKRGYYVQQSGTTQPASTQNLLYGLNNQFYLNFYSNTYKEEFEDRIKAASGIYDEYLNELFDDTKGIGASVIYGYANDVRIGNTQLNLNNYPQAVATKYVGQNFWISGCSTFTGLSIGNIKNLGQNSVLQLCNSKTPTEMLGTLMRGYNPNIGVVGIDDIAIIIGLIISAISAAAGLMSKSRQKAESIQEDVPSNWIPVGPGLEFVEDDWDTAPTNSGGGNNGGGGGAGTDSSKWIIGGGLAALGIYLLSSQNKD